MDRAQGNGGPRRRRSSLRCSQGHIVPVAHLEDLVDELVPAPGAPGAGEVVGHVGRITVQ